MTTVVVVLVLTIFLVVIVIDDGVMPSTKFDVQLIYLKITKVRHRRAFERKRSTLLFS